MPTHLDLNNLNLIPAELTGIDQWIMWCYGQQLPAGKLAKSPVGKDGTSTAWQQKHQWLSFNDAVAKSQTGGYAGIGFVLPAQTTNGKWIVALDFDDVDIAPGHSNPRKDEIIDIWASLGEPYIEFSPSGKGARMFVLSDTKLPQISRNNPLGGKDELFCGSLKYVTCTANVLSGSGCPDATAAIGALYAKWSAASQQKPPQVQAQAKVQAQAHLQLQAGSLPTELVGAIRVKQGALSPLAGGLPTGALLDVLKSELHSALHHLRDRASLGNREHWIRYGLMLKPLGEVGWALWKEFSEYADGHDDEAALRTRWEGFNANHGQYQVIFKDAQAEGWTNPRANTALAALNADDPVRKFGEVNDTANAYRLARALSGQVMYCTGMGAWLIYVGNRWHRDDTSKITELAQQVLADILVEANAYAKAGDTGRFKLLANHATNSLNDSRLNAAINLLKAVQGFTVQPSQLDQNPLAVQSRNGYIIDTKSGVGRQVVSGDFLTRALAADWDPDATCPLWERTLHEIFCGDQTVVDFIQRLCGYCLTGPITEQVFIFLYGQGANGKSLFVNTLRELLGDYATQMPPEALMLQKGASANGATPHLARLPGVRLVTANETGEGNRLDEALVKQATGGDAITARPLYGQPFDFVPSFKLIMAGNYRPIIKGDDNGIWRRLVLVPFNLTLPKGKQDGDLLRKLRAEFPGILNWMLQGAKEWHKVGLNTPKLIRDNSNSYRADMDTLQQWFDDECEADATAKTLAADAYAAFRRYLQAGGQEPPSQQRFGAKMSARGYPSTKGGKGARVYKGFRVRTVPVHLDR